MPFGLDTPSTIGMALLVLGPAFARFRAAGTSPDRRRARDLVSRDGGHAHDGRVKLVLAFARPARAAHDSAGGTARIAGGNRADADRLSAPGRAAADAGRGILTLGLVLYALRRAGDDSLAACRACCSQSSWERWFITCSAAARRGNGAQAPALPTLRLAFPHPDSGILHGFRGLSPTYLPLTPTVRAADRDRRRQQHGKRQGRAAMPMTCAAFCWAKPAPRCSAGVAGGVAQTTPYIGHPALQADGREGGLYVAHRHVHRRGRDARVCVESDRAHSDCRSGAGARVHCDGHHGAGLSGGAVAARARRGDRASFPRSRAC